MKILVMPDRNTASILVRAHHHMTANPDALWISKSNEWTANYRTAEQWLVWFYECLTNKINSRLPFKWGTGAKAKWRAQRIADAKAECKWCGQLTSSTSKQFCEASCARSYHN